MRLPLFAFVLLAPAPLAAQGQAPIAVEFDLAAQPVASTPAEPEVVMVQFDLNGNPISPNAPACRQPDAAAGAAPDASAGAAPDTSAEAAEDDEDWGIAAFLEQCPAPVTRPAASDGTNSFGFGEDPFAVRSEARADDVRVEREYTERCTETLLERSCSSSGSVTIGNSEAGRNAARAALDALRDDD